MALADNVSIFPGITNKDFDADVMLEAASGQGLDSVIVIGWDKDGDLFFSSSMSDGPEALWLLEKAKAALLAAGGE